MAEPFVPDVNTELLSRSIDDYPGGIIIPIDKPYRWTSADVIRKVKFAAIRHFGKKNLKVGHAGTLDPLATGVLLVCIGNATKLADDLQRHDKAYVAGVTFGATTPSYDLEKDIDQRYPYEHIDEASVRDALVGFIGEQDQVAPLFSAKSVDGVRAYEIARKAFKAGEPIPDDVLRASRITSDAADLYLRLGNRNGWALMTLQKLRAQKQLPDYKLRLKQPDYLEALRQLVDQTQDLEAGADVGLDYVEGLSLPDEQIDFIHWAYQHYGQSPLINSFKNLERDILSVEAEVSTKGNLLPGRPFDLPIRYRNATRVNIEVRQFNGLRNYRPRTDGALVLKRQYTLGDDPESQSRRSHGYPVKGEHTDQLTLPAGHYVLISTVNGESQKVEEFHVFALQMAIFRLPGNQCLVQVRDIRTGRPVPNAHLELTNVAHQRTLTTDPNGEVIISDLNRFDIVASIPGTHEVSDRLSFSAYNYTPREGSPTHCNLFTDRAIYRPGQTLHLSGIIYSQQGDDTQVVARHFDTATLYDANHRKVQEQKLVTNELGSFSLDFTLPQEGLPGDYSLQVMGQSTHFRVEEYKRPTFTTEAKVIGHEGRGFGPHLCRCSRTGGPCALLHQHPSHLLPPLARPGLGGHRRG